MQVREMLEKASSCRSFMRTLDTDTKNRALAAMADRLVSDTDIILGANEKDMADATGSISDVMLDRLMLNPKRIEDMAEGIRNVAALPDPVGRVLETTTGAEGIAIRKVSVPMGVIAIIYESRPNVTSDAAALCLKSGNVCVLRSGKEAFRSAHVITDSMRAALKDQGLPEDIISMVDDPSRDSAAALMKASGLVDLLIPRGGAGLIKSCVENATVPVIETGVGICSIYVDSSADLEMALRIIDNAKTQRPSVCNAMEVLLVAEDIAQDFLPKVRDLLVDQRIAGGKVPVELRLCEKASGIIEGTPAGEKDFDTEFLDYILAVKVVSGVDEACSHIEEHSTRHSDAIIASDPAAADYFTSHVDSAAVYVNASTRFTDGGVFGLGCEMGISTQRLHARGPMGLRELNTYKYIITGNGQVRR